MIQGKVTSDCEAVLSLEVLGPEGQATLVRAALDTGFNAYLTLPTSVIAELKLPFHSIATAMLADGTRVALRKYQAAVTWDCRKRPIMVLESDGGPLVGRAMSRGHRLTMDILPDGNVTIEPTPS